MPAGKSVCQNIALKRGFYRLGHLYKSGEREREMVGQGKPTLRGESGPLRVTGVKREISNMF